MQGFSQTLKKDAAHLLVKIPSSCPFERDIHLLNWTIHIPPLCKLNPFYGKIMEAKWWALCYLADVCGEDVSGYCL